ncbi:Signal transduction response regulator, receiver region domain protein [Candidatus Magnetomorum sp. HK-1]|nr:Signal transduction response regulator, receiver region domain protein [Candidatus Magnetomorum sp. HK-1]
MSKKILVVDDDPNIVDYLTTLFEDNGYIVDSASDAQKGLDMAKAEPPDLITLDIEMPGDWGPRFYRKMTQIDTLKNIPVIVISGLTSNQYAVQKAVATISKPFDKNELIKIVKDTLME